MDSNYHILWIDDEWEAMTSFQTFCKLHYKMELHPFKTQKEGLDEYAKHPDFYEAVILDAKVLDESEHEVPDIGSLNKAVLRIKEQFRNFPYFISTGQPDLLSSSMFTSLFPIHYEKSIEDEKLCRDIIEAIKDKPIRKLRNKYPLEFDAASLIPNAESLLIKGLMSDVTDYSSNQTIVDSFNPVRMLCENIIDKCQETGYIPYISSLNSVCDFLEQKEVEGFKLTTPIMHKTLIRSLDYFLSITQDGSHDKSGLSLEVIDYVRNRHNDNLYKTILYIAMDLLLWYKDLINSSIDPESIWTGSYEAKGKVCAVMNGERLAYIVNGVYQIENNGELQDGSMIYILKSHPNKHSFGNVTKFVFKTNYKVIKK